MIEKNMDKKKEDFCEFQRYIFEKVRILCLSP